MIGFEPSGDDIFETLSEDIIETTVIETNGILTISRVDPEKVERLVRELMIKGINQIKYRKGEIRKLDPDLARMFAESARDILGYTVEELDRLGIPLTTASNWGSTTTGLVTMKSDVDVLLGVPTTADLQTAVHVLRNDQSFQNGLWRLHTPVRIPSVTFSLTVPSVYSKNPGEMDQWFPGTSPKVTLKHPLF